jgi:hypothetical protein
MSICWFDAILVPASAFPASAEPPGVLHVEEPGAPPVQDELHAELQAAIRFVEQVQHATPHEVLAQAAIRHGFRERDEIQREAQWLRATLSSVFP